MKFPKVWKRAMKEDESFYQQSRPTVGYFVAREGCLWRHSIESDGSWGADSINIGNRGFTTKQLLDTDWKLCGY